MSSESEESSFRPFISSESEELPLRPFVADEPDALLFRLEFDFVPPEDAEEEREREVEVDVEDDRDRGGEADLVFIARNSPACRDRVPCRFPANRQQKKFFLTLEQSPALPDQSAMPNRFRTR